LLTWLGARSLVNPTQEVSLWNEPVLTSTKEKLSERYPQAAAEELSKRFGIVWLGPELAEEAFGWEVDEDDSDLMAE